MGPTTWRVTFRRVHDAAATGKKDANQPNRPGPRGGRLGGYSLAHEGIRGQLLLVGRSICLAHQRCCPASPRFHHWFCCHYAPVSLGSVAESLFGNIESATLVTAVAVPLLPSRTTIPHNDVSGTVSYWQCSQP